MERETRTPVHRPAPMGGQPFENMVASHPFAQQMNSHTPDPQQPNSPAAPPGVVCSELLAAVELALDEWAWIQGGSREPLSFTLRRPENEIKVFKMVVSMNNLKRRYEKWKAANTKLSHGGDE